MTFDSGKFVQTNSKPETNPPKPRVTSKYFPEEKIQITKNQLKEAFYKAICLRWPQAFEVLCKELGFDK